MKVLQKLALTWKEAKHVAQNRRPWKDLIYRIVELDSLDALTSNLTIDLSAHEMP